MNTTACRNCIQTHGIASNLAARERGYSGIHYEVFNVLRQYGRMANGRDEALRELKKLLREYEQEYFGEEDESDDEYLSKFDDL